MSAFAICNSFFSTFLVVGSLNFSIAINFGEMHQPFSCAFTAARCCRVLMTTLAIAIFPLSSSASRNST